MAREDVIKGLECCAEMSGGKCRECPYSKECFDTNLPYGMPHLAADALALLKAQEPRVMTYDELATFDGAFLIESSAISQLDWVFFFDTDTKSDAIWVEGFDEKRCVVYREDYGTYMRCWTSRPSDEVREATPWE